MPVTLWCVMQIGGMQRWPVELRCAELWWGDLEVGKSWWFEETVFHWYTAGDAGAIASASLIDGAQQHVRHASCDHPFAAQRFRLLELRRYGRLLATAAAARTW